MPAWVVPAISAGVQLAGGIAGSMGAKKDAKRAAKRQAMLTGLQREQEITSQEIANRQQLGSARLASFASGLQQSGSTVQYQNMLLAEQRRQMDYLSKANLAEQQAIMAGAQGAGRGLLIQGIMGAAASGVEAGYQYGLGKGYWGGS